MKTNYFIFFIMLSILWGCKDHNSEGDVIVGGTYVNLTNQSFSTLKTSITINDSILNFQRIEAGYIALHPGIKPHVFIMSFIDTTKEVLNRLSIEFYTTPFNPETFFKKGTFNIDTIYISNSVIVPNSTFGEFFAQANLKFTWETASLENRNFKGNGYFEILDTIQCKIANIIYPKQKVNFEFE